MCRVVLDHVDKEQKADNSMSFKKPSYVLVKTA